MYLTIKFKDVKKMFSRSTSIADWPSTWAVHEPACGAQHTAYSSTWTVREPAFGAQHTAYSSTWAVHKPACSAQHTAHSSMWAVHEPAFGAQHTAHSCTWAVHEPACGAQHTAYSSTWVVREPACGTQRTAHSCLPSVLCPIRTPESFTVLLTEITTTASQLLFLQVCMVPSAVPVIATHIPKTTGNWTHPKLQCTDMLIQSLNDCMYNLAKLS